MQAVSKTTSILGGVRDKGLSSAFSFAGDMVGRAGNVISGALECASRGADSAVSSINRVAEATGNVRRVGTLASTLNSAATGITSSLGLVGKVAGSVVEAASGVAGSTLGEFGSLVNRMVNVKGNKPTPMESYVGMVTKEKMKDMKGTTMA